MKKIILLVIFLLLPTTVWSKRLKFQLDLIYRVGIDKGVILKNELHQIDYLELNKIMYIKLKGRLKVQLYFKKKLGEKWSNLSGLICKYKIFNVHNTELHRSAKNNFFKFNKIKKVDLFGKNHSLMIGIKIY